MKKKPLHVVIMQITFIQLAIILSLMGSAIAKDSKAQGTLNTNVTVNAESQKFYKVLSSLENQTEFKFIYSSAIINSDRKVSLSVANKPLGDVLNALLPDLKLTYRVSGNVILIKRFSKDEAVEDKEFAVVRVSGKVTDEKGESLPGVSVKVAETSAGTVTDANGTYSISAPEGSSLLFSYLGYLPQTVRVREGTINIVMQVDQAGTQLNEVVVVGYGTQKRSDITGSVASVSKERLSKLPVNNVMQAIQGAVSNVTVNQASSIPGDAPSVQVRGRSSISATSQPYVVVDGIPLSKTDGTINDINPNDIESVEILKDPSAVAIYGVNGSNGVILITTKRGTTAKPAIRYSTYAGVENATDVLEGVSGEEMLARYAEYSRINSLPLYNGVGPVRNEYELENYENGVTIDWLDAVMQTGVNQNHNLSLSGGSEFAKYYVSGDYMTQKGVVLGYDYKRYSFRLNTDIKPTKYLTVGTSSFVVSHNRDGGRAHLLNAMAMSPFAKMYEDNGSLTQNPMKGESLWANPLLPTTINPQRRSFNMTLNGYGEFNFGELVKPLNGLKFRLNAGYTYVPGRENRYEGETVYNVAGFGRLVNTEAQSYTIENILTYNKDIGKHHIDFTGLYGARQKYFQRVEAEGTGFPNDDLEWGNLNGAATQVTRSFADKYNTISQMARLYYGYDSRYMATLTVRRDGSSVFGVNNKYGVFPAAALAWNIHNESFMKPLANVVDNLKLRVSYGLAGNEAINIYESLSLLNTNGLAMGGQSRTALDVRALMGNENLQWEKSRSFNTGVDFGVLNNRISGSIDFYKTKTYDLLLRQNLARLTGYEQVISNLGELSNTGLDLTLNTRNIVKKDFTWSSTVVFATNKNKIVNLYGDGQSDRNNRWFIGEPIGVLFDYTKVGIWQEEEIVAGAHTNWDPSAKPGDLKIADISKDGKIDDQDRSIRGQEAPKWTGGLTNTFTFKDFSLNIFINTVQGTSAWNRQLGVAGDEMGRRNSPAIIGYWTRENKSNEFRSLSNTSNRYGYGYAEDASFTRLKDVTLSYTLPNSVVSKIGIGGLQLYASGRNLYTWTNWVGWDPESRDIARGSENSDINYPMVRSFVLGVNVNF